MDARERQQVSDYFSAVDPVMEEAATWDSADSVTQAVVAQAAQGDPAGLKRILEENRKALQALDAIRPPAPCRAHHRLAREVIESAARLVALLGTEALTPMQATSYDDTPAARELQRKVRELREARSQVLSRYGI